MKRAILVHGWGGYPQEGWLPWLKKELEDQHFAVQVPQLPDTENPHINTWIPALAEVVGTPDAQTFFVGHSMGAEAIARYLETLPEGVTVGGAVFVAGFFKRLTNLWGGEKEREIASHWLDTPLDLSKVRQHLPRSVAIFSDNDKWVPLDNADDFREQLASEIIVEHERGHFSGSEGTTELPVALDALLRIAS